MGNKNENLRNYILSKIIQRVHLNNKTLSFVEDKTELTDELLGTLIAECAKYGLHERDARSFITQTADNISIKPSINTIKNKISVDEIDVGQHLSLHFSNDRHGILSLGLVCLEPNCFIVIQSDVPGLISLDIIHSMQTDWNMEYDIRFNILRNGKRHPNSDTCLQIGTLESVDIYTPSYIHRIFDSAEDYTHEGWLLKCHAVGEKYVNYPKNIDGRIVFFADNKDDIPQDSFFIISPNEDRDTATLLLNTDYINELLRNGKDNQLQKIFGCCEVSDRGVCDFEKKSVVMEEPGVLQCSDLSSPNAFWFITARPIITFE